MCSTVDNRTGGDGEVGGAPEDVGNLNQPILVHESIEDKGHIEEAICHP